MIRIGTLVYSVQMYIILSTFADERRDICLSLYTQPLQFIAKSRELLQLIVALKRKAAIYSTCTVVQI